MVGVDWVYAANQNANLGDDPFYDLGERQIWNARVGVLSDDGRWTLTLWGRNITNEFYAVSVVRLADSISRFTGEPETYGVSASYRF